MINKPQIDIVLTPDSYKKDGNLNKIIVVIDILRATSTICTAFYYGASEIVPVETIGDALKLKSKGYLAAGERELVIVPGFDFGNSPFEFMNSQIKDAKIVSSTTNGTYTLNVAKGDGEIVIGCFLNHHVLSEWIIKQNKSVVLLCAGRLRKIAIEDAIYAGKLAESLLDSGMFSYSSETVSVSINLWQQAKSNLFDFVLKMSPKIKEHIKFLENDLIYCLSDINLKIVPVLKEQTLYPIKLDN